MGIEGERLMNNEDNFEKVLVLSTAHMPNSTPDFGGIRHKEHEHGFILFPASRESVIPRWLRPILIEVWRNKCSLVNFDSDASTYDALETWDW